MVKRRRVKSKLHLKPRDRLLLLLFAVILLMSVALATYLGLQMAGQSHGPSSHEQHASRNFQDSLYDRG
jgi:CHASE3 domain sensor protein